MNSVQFLLKIKFSTLSYENKIRVKQLGRPIPELKIEVSCSSRNKLYKRQFNNIVYLNTKWICGCEVINALFCFPCMLFGGEKSWTVTGFTDLSHLSQSIKRHETTKNHITNEVNLAFFGNMNIRSQLDSTYWINIRKHNDHVTKNRYVLSRIIDCIKFCGAFELALRGQNESIFRGLINFSAEMDNSLREHFENATLFKGTSKDNIQNELLQCMLEVCREQIVKEISAANYLAVMADETTDATSKFQIVLVLRYVTDGNPVERFWGFINPTNNNSEVLASCIRSVIDPLLKDAPNKLIAQAYDGAAVKSGKFADCVDTKIREQYPMAHFVHCYSHQLNTIMSQESSARNTKVRIFFANIDEVINFFTSSPQRIDLLNEVVGKRILEPETGWDFKNRSVNLIYENREALIECMIKIQDEFFNGKVINQASAIERLLKDKTFLFWLNIFQYIMPHVDVLCSQILKRDTTEIKNSIDKFEECINDIRQNMDNIIRNGIEDLMTEPSAKISRTSATTETDEEDRDAALEVCDVVINTAKSRFQCTNHLVAGTLFSSEHFHGYSSNFPNDALMIATALYPVLERDRLKTELSIIYTRPDFRGLTGALPFLNTLLANNLEGPFRETIKLLQILVTVPMSTSEPVRCLSTLKRIKNFLRNTVTDDRLSAFAMLSIENSLVREDINFNEKVIEKFVNLNLRLMDLIYKK